MLVLFEIALALGRSGGRLAYIDAVVATAGRTSRAGTRDSAAGSRFEQVSVRTALTGVALVQRGIGKALQATPIGADLLRHLGRDDGHLFEAGIGGVAPGGKCSRGGAGRRG